MIISADQKFLLNKEMGPVGAKVGLGDVIEGIGQDIAALQTDDSGEIKKTAKGQYDFGASGGAQGTFALGVNIPDNAIITRAWVEVLTTLTSGTDAATVALHAEGADDIVAAIAISNGGNPWDAGFHEGIQDGAAANMIKMSALRALTATVAVEDLTAGKFNVFVEYYISE